MKENSLHSNAISKKVPLNSTSISEVGMISLSCPLLESGAGPFYLQVEGCSFAGRGMTLGLATVFSGNNMLNKLQARG